jgi:hypothetical protein
MKRRPSSPDFRSSEHEWFWKGAGNARRRNRPEKSSTGGPALLDYCVKGMCKSQQDRQDSRSDAVAAVDSGEAKLCCSGAGDGRGGGAREGESEELSCDGVRLPT